jgi:hypothetical protein
LKAFEHQPSSYQGPPPGIPFAASQAASIDKLGQLTVQKLPGRVDFVVTPVPSAAHVVPSIDNVNEALDKIQKVTSNVASSTEHIARISIIADLGIPANSAINANEIVTKIIPFSVKITDELDFSLQFTRRFTSSSVPEIQINCLRRWSVTQMQQLLLPPTILSSATMVQVGSPQFIAQLLLDVNTVPEAKSFTGEQAGRILRELRERVDSIRRGQEDN